MVEFSSATVRIYGVVYVARKYLVRKSCVFKLDHFLLESLYNCKSYFTIRPEIFTLRVYETHSRKEKRSFPIFDIHDVKQQQPQ